MATICVRLEGMMDTGTVGSTLHDRATRGETLTSQEQAALDAWYATQDSAEAVHLGFGSGTQKAVSGQIAESGASADTLQRQIDMLLERIASVTTQVQLLMEQNSVLRQENRLLQQKLARHLAIEMT